MWGNEVGGPRVRGVLEVWRGGFGFVREDGTSHSDVFIHRREWPPNVPLALGTRLSFVVVNQGRSPRAILVGPASEDGNGARP